MIKKKNIKPSLLPALSLSALLASSLLVSCDLDYAPENTYVDEKVYKMEKTSEAALMGAYVRLDVFLSGAPQDQNNNANSGYAYLLGDLGTENLEARDNSATYLAMQTSEYTSAQHSDLLYNLWLWGYNAADYANNIIAGVQRYARYDEAKSRQFVAEARFIRAYVYLQLLTMFGDQALLNHPDGPGIVLRLEPYNGYDPNHHSPRSSNELCWQQIISDLTQAIPDLPAQALEPSQRVRATQAVAQALLARTYLRKATASGNVAELSAAAEQARAVLANESYTFATEPTEYSTNLFPSNEYSQLSGYPNPSGRSGEVLFMEPSRVYTDNFPNGLSYYRKQSYFVPSAMRNIYDATDVRRLLFVAQGSLSDNPNDFTSGKYRGGSYDDVIYLRLAEVKLTLAEAAARVAGAVTQEAVDQLNAVHQRAYATASRPAAYTLSSFASLDDFLREVLTERRRELCHEGMYRFDLMRTNNLLGDSKLATIPQNRWNLPVPEYEIRITEGLVSQNSGYEETGVEE